MLDQVQMKTRGRALVSDDDDFFRVAIRSVLLERNNFSDVVETPSFNEAVNCLQNDNDFAIGLFDLNMVGMDNWLDLSALRCEFPDMRLVVVSASRQREDILRALEIGAHGFIHKGLGVCELSRAVGLICEGQVYVPPFLPENAMPRINAAPYAGDHRVDSDAPVVHLDETFGKDGSRQKPEAKTPLNCSPRQREILDLLIAGYSNKAMAREMDLSEGTIKFHMSAVMRLLGVRSRVEAATRAMTLMAGRT